jgi:hypothetical protein
MALQVLRLFIDSAKHDRKGELVEGDGFEVSSLPRWCHVTDGTSSLPVATKIWQPFLKSITIVCLQIASSDKVQHTIYPSAQPKPKLRTCRRGKRVDRNSLTSTMNTKHLICLILAVAIGALAQSETIENEEPDSIESWLKLIELPDFRTLSAVDVNGHYFAIKINRDGDILVASHKHGDLAGYTGGYSTIIESTEGQNLLAGELEIAKNAYYVVHRKIDGIDTRTKTACPRGVIYKLKRHKEKSVRVRYLADRVNDKKVEEILNQTVHLTTGAG